MQKSTQKLLCLGLYAVICHLCGILLFYNFSDSTLPSELLTARCSQMLEYSLMSILILCVGGCALEVVNKAAKNNIQ